MRPSAPFILFTGRRASVPIDGIVFGWFNLQLVFVFANFISPVLQELENGEQIEECMPSDQVLGSRLRNLIEALPNGLTAHALQKRARKNEASRKSKARHEQG